MLFEYLEQEKCILVVNEGCKDYKGELSQVLN